MNTAPLHTRSSHAFLIARTEVTFADWIEYLDALPDAERKQRAPHDTNTKTIGNDGSISLRRVAGAWRLALAPATVSYDAVEGAPIHYARRDTRAAQDWRRFPVSGIDGADAEAYAAWLAATGRVPHARLCTDAEWEYAARGVDARPWPDGDKLEPDDANIDATYGHEPGGFGPDIVGAHPRSTSPFGLADTSGNVWEIVRSTSGFATRGGCWYMTATVAHLANRQDLPPGYRDNQIGTRICADLPPQGPVSHR
jgi:formylglycine-generating enzyme required for sulfatase activity